MTYPWKKKLIEDVGPQNVIRRKWYRKVTEQLKLNLKIVKILSGLKWDNNLPR